MLFSLYLDGSLGGGHVRLTNRIILYSLLQSFHIDVCVCVCVIVHGVREESGGRRVVQSRRLFGVQSG